MALRSIASFLAIWAAAAAASAQSLTIEIYNNTAVDLCIYGESRMQCADVVPAASGQFEVPERSWIDFGMMSHEYQYPKPAASTGSGPKKRRLRLQAEPDGKLYLIPDEVIFPAEPLPTQPSDFPLSPVRVVDLT